MVGQLEPDHVIPISDNGPDDISNIQPLCHECNAEKGGRQIDYRPGFLSQNKGTVTKITETL
jgi:5-methylcytosine-specific restriction endonuclease McrA